MIKKDKNLIILVLEILIMTIIVSVIYISTIVGLNIVMPGFEKLGFGVLATLFIFFWKRDWVSKELAEKTETPLKTKEILYIVVLSIFMPVIIDIMLSKLNLSVEIKQEYLKRVSSNLLIMMIVPIILAPIYEEFFFRGYIYRKLRQKVDWKFAALLSAIIFAVLHINRFQMIHALPLGIILSYSYERSKSLRIPIVGHVVNNVLAVLGRVRMGVTSSIIPNYFGKWSLIIGGGILLYFIVVYVNNS